MTFSPEGIANLIRFSLHPIGRWTFEVETHLLMICAHESLLGEELVQIGGGPARGLYGMECGVDPRTGKHRTEIDIWRNYITYHKDIAEYLKNFCGVTGPDTEAMTHNHVYSTVMCRLKLLMCPGKLPRTIDDTAEYCSRFYNAGGAGTAAKYKNDYLRLVVR